MNSPTLSGQPSPRINRGFYSRLMLRLYPVFVTIILTIGLAGVTGCSTLPATFSSDQGQTLTSTSYSAADMLMQQSHAAIDKTTPLHIGVLTDIHDPAELTAFGQMVAGHIGARFVQLGYTVNMSSFDDMMMMKEKAAEKATAGGAAQTFTGQAADADPDRVMITGQYAVARNDVLVNLRLINPGSGRILAAYDYAVPKTADVRSLTRKESDKESFFSF